MPIKSAHWSYTDNGDGTTNHFLLGPNGVRSNVPVAGTDASGNTVLVGADGNYGLTGKYPATRDSSGINALIAQYQVLGFTGAIVYEDAEYTIDADIELASGVSHIGVPPKIAYTADVPEAGLSVTGGTRFLLSAGITGFKANNVDNAVEDANVASGALSGVLISGITFIGGARAIDIGAYLKIGAINCEFKELYGFDQTEDFSFNYENFQGVTFSGNHYAHTTLTSGGGIRLANSLSATFIPGNSNITGWMFSYSKYRLNRSIVIESAGPAGGILNEIKVSGRLQGNRYGAATPDIIAMTTTSGTVDISVPDVSVFALGVPVVFHTTAPTGFSVNAAYFVISIGASTVQLGQNPYDTVGITPTSTASYNASFSGFPAIEIRATADNSIKNSDFGQLDAEAYGNVAAVVIAKTRNCVGFLAEAMTSATDTQIVMRDAEFGMTYAGLGNVTQDQGGNYGYCNVKNISGGPYTYSGGSFTLSSTWAERDVRYTGTADITITVPNSLPKGFSFSITPTAATGIVTFAAESGGAVFSKSGLRTNGQYATAVLENIANKVYRLRGELQV